MAGTISLSIGDNEECTFRGQPPGSPGIPGIPGIHSNLLRSAVRIEPPYALIVIAVAKIVDGAFKANRLRALPVEKCCYSGRLSLRHPFDDM